MSDVSKSWMSILRLVLGSRAAKTQAKKRFTSFCWLAILFFPSFIHAHPHSWIEMKTLIEGQNGKISGLKMEWTFDAMTSAYMLDGEDISEGNEPKTLRKVAHSIVKDMLSEHYFTYFYDGDQPIKYQTALEPQLVRDKAKLMLSFRLPLAKEQPVTRDTLRLLVFDSSHFVDMVWKSKQDIVLSDELAKNCRLDLIEPNPSSEQMMYAMSLPEDADPDNSLGQLFTQTVNVHCASVTNPS